MFELTGLPGRRVARGCAAATVAACGVVLALIGCAGGAMAQSYIVERDISGFGTAGSLSTDGTILRIGIDDCETLIGDEIDLTFEWTVLASAAGESFSVKVGRPYDSADCDTTTTQSNGEAESTDAASDLCFGAVIAETVSGTTISVELDTLEYFGFTTVADCEGTNNDTDVFLILPTTDLTSTTLESDSLQIDLDGVRPVAPTGLSVNAGESTLEIDWDEPSEQDGYTVYVSTSPLVQGTAAAEITGASSDEVTSTSVSFNSGIVADQTYYVGVTVFDAAGNESALSEVVQVTTQQADDFWEYYKGNGGSEAGEFCNTAPARSGLPLALALGLVALRRRGGANA